MYGLIFSTVLVRWSHIFSAGFSSGLWLSCFKTIWRKETPHHDAARPIFYHGIPLGTCNVLFMPCKPFGIVAQKLHFCSLRKYIISQKIFRKFLTRTGCFIWQKPILFTNSTTLVMLLPIFSSVTYHCPHSKLVFTQLFWKFGKAIFYFCTS